MNCNDCNKKITTKTSYRCFDCEKYICEGCGTAHFKDNPPKLMWKRRVPNKTGHWIRLNSSAQLVVHKVTNNNGLFIDWSNDFVKIKDNKRILGGFMWFGPFQHPPKGKIYVKQEIK